jgi:hypothetical protein
VTWKRRGLPDGPASASRAKARPATRSKSKRRGRRLFRLVVRILVMWIAVVVVYSALFIGMKCYGRPTQSPSAVPPSADGLAGYTRSESFTYLTLPEWFIVYSTDEYASFISTRPPSAFPYFRSARQYWGYYGSACAATKGVYPFETGYHVMLGIIGASFTIESSLKSVYESSIGRLTEWLSSIDTPEDAFARRTAKEYGTFMHTVPWYEFPFGSKLTALWRETPLTGPHMLRKIERRLALTADYGFKAAYGFVIGKASGAAYGAEDLRIYARIDNASPSVFSDARVKQVKQLGKGDYVVTLPRYEEFTRTALALTEAGVRFVDIAGNDEMLVTVLARRGISTNVPDAQLIAAAPVLTEPTMQRLGFSVQVRSLREVAAHLGRAGATIEHLYDY